MTGKRTNKILFALFQSLIFLILIILGYLVYVGFQKHRDLLSSIERYEHNESVLAERLERLEGYRNRLRQHEIFTEILNQTIEVRGLPTYKIVSIESAEEDFLVSYLEKQLETQMGERLVHIQDILKKMALIEPDYDIQAELTQLYLDQTAGFYDYEEKLFYIMDNFRMTNVLGKIIVAHELTHFLQDQHFNIERLLNEYDKNTDQQTAILSILEGDATLAMMEWSMEYGIPGSLQELTDFLVIGDAQFEFGRSPQIIQDLMIQPYIIGLDFFLYLQNSGIEDWRNKPFKKPPVSTEMVIHPEKYLAYEDFPRELEVPDSYLETHGEVIYTDSFGELYLRSLIREFNQHDSLRTNQIAAGWNGDKFALFENGHLLWLVCFDTDQDESEFEQFLEVSEEYWKSKLEKVDVQLQWDKYEDIFYLEFNTTS